MANSISIFPNRVLDANGDPVPGAKAYFYQSGTTTPVTVYSDQACTIPHPTPLEADGNGVFPAFYPASAAAVKVDVTTALGAAVPGYPIDPVVITSSASTGASSVSFSPTVEIPVTNVQAAIEAVQGNLDDLGVTATGAALISAASAASARATLDVPEAGNITTADIAPATLVTASETIGSNNNDTTIPTSAAVKAYADAAFDPTTAAARIKTPMFTSGAAAQTQTFTGLGDYGGVGFSLFVRNTTGGETIRFQYSTNGGSSWSTAYSLISSVTTTTVFTVVGHFDFNSGLFTIVGSETTTALHRASTTLSGSSLAIDAIRFTGSAAGVTCVAMITPNGGTV